MQHIFLPTHKHAFGRPLCERDDLRHMGLTVENLRGRMLLGCLPDEWRKSEEGSLTFFHQWDGGRWVLRFFITCGSVCFV